MQIISLLTRRNTEIFPSALYMISLNQSLNLPYCDEFLLTYKKLIKILVIAGEKIGHSYPFRTPTMNMLTGRSKQSNTQMCLQYREGDFSWKPCDSTLNTNRQNIGLDTEYNSNWDSPKIFPSVHVIASDDEGITPLTQDGKVKAE